MKNISLFLDFNKISTSLLQWVTFIKEKTNSQPIFCNINGIQNSKDISKNLILENNEEVVFPDLNNLDSLLPDYLQSSFPELSSYPVFNLDKIFENEKLLKEVLDTNLIILSCKDIDEEKGLFIDGIAAKIIQNANCPILFIPENTDRLVDLNKIIFNSDIRFTELRHLKAFSIFSNILNAELTLAHISDNEMPEPDMAYAHQIFRDNLEGKIKDTIINFEIIKRLDVKKYPDLIHEYLMGDIYAMVNKNKQVREGIYLSCPAITLSGLANKPTLLITN